MERFDRMPPEIITKPLQLTVHGFSDTASNKDYVGMAFKLSGKMWEVVKSNQLNNKGKNIWIYEPNDLVFAGVELGEMPPANTGLELKRIDLNKYACDKHVGPYQLIKQAGQQALAKLTEQEVKTMLPCIEIYGHWNSDESKLETELIWALR